VRAPALVALCAILAGAAFRLYVALKPVNALAARYLADDYFYFLSVARHLAAGQGSTFDGGVSYTNGYQPLFAWLLAGLFALGLGKTAAIHGGLVLITVAGAAAAWAAFRLLEEEGRPWGGAFAAGVLGLGLFHSLAALTGFETPLAIAGVLWTLLLARRGAGPAWLGIVCGVSVLARVDALPLVGLLALPLARRKDVAGLARMAAAFALVVGPWVVWSLVRFGTPVHDSSAVKARLRAPGSIVHAGRLVARESARSVLPETLLGPRHQPRAPVVVAGAFAVLALAVAGARRFPVAAGYAFAVAAAYAVLTDTSDTGALARYLHPVWAIVTVLAAGNRLLQHPLPVVVLLLLHAREAREYVRWDSGTPAELSFVGAAHVLAPPVLERTVPDGDRVGAFDAGALGYASPRGVVNLDGLMNHDIVRMRRACDRPSRECMLDYLHEKRITVLAGGTGFAWTRVFPDWTEWTLLYASPVLRDGDRLVVLRVPGVSGGDPSAGGM